MPEVVPNNTVFEELLGQDVLLILDATQLNILGQTFRAVFSGRLAEVYIGSIRLEPAIIKMQNAPFYQFPTPLVFPIEHIVSIMPFERDRRLPLI
ncbi:hypothetical protein [Paenibacillus tarimensis]|uniref:hypothetical protein n=1 Tax=Paenibacillus tarimensis TaxID=416012 RepID=UPI001F236041|nr:hypothetical protein [Paenibacillus tarimensis]MCF2945555.1 hypothetical protein [Paenibacillus tarimensis]